MESKMLIERLLRFGSDWKVKDIQIDDNFQEIIIYIEYTKGTGICPHTKEECSIYDFRKSRRLRHLDILDYKTYIDLRIPRIKNAKDKVLSIELDFADKLVSYTYLFEAYAIKTLLLSKNQSKTAEHLDISYDVVHAIMHRAVSRGLAQRKTDNVMAISLDEKSFQSGHHYFTVLSDPLNKRVLDIIEGRDEEATMELITWAIHPEQLPNITLGVMDMWKPYMKAVNEVLPNADIVHDKFHISKYLNNAVDAVRKTEVKKEAALKHTKYIFLKNPQEWTFEQQVKFDEVKKINAKTSKAWEIKENFKSFYQQWNFEQCISFFKQWYEDTLMTGIKSMIKAADTILNHLEGVVNAALTGITNSSAENINAQIQVVKTVGRGYANINSYRNAILFFNGKLQLYPLKIL